MIEVPMVGEEVTTESVATMLEGGVEVTSDTMEMSEGQVEVTSEIPQEN